MPRDRLESTPGSAHARFADLLIAETIRAIERAGPLEDEAALRAAFVHADGREARLIERARLLARRLSLESELAHWRDTAWLAGLALVVLAFLGAYGIAAAVVGGSRTVNAITAFFALLAVPTLTLVLWGTTVLFGARDGRSGHLSFGNILLRMLSRLPGARHAHAPTMAQAAHALLRRTRLLPWAFGLVSHAVWAAAFIVILMVRVFVPAIPVELGDHHPRSRILCALRHPDRRASPLARLSVAGCGHAADARCSRQRPSCLGLVADRLRPRIRLAAARGARLRMLGHVAARFAHDAARHGAS